MRRKPLPCALCGTVENTPFFYHGGTDFHGVDGHESDQPLCVRCARLMIWGSFEAPDLGTRKGKKGVVNAR
jgi:hypothetical protein